MYILISEKQMKNQNDTEVKLKKLIELMNKPKVTNDPQGIDSMSTLVITGYILGLSWILNDGPDQIDELIKDPSKGV